MIKPLYWFVPLLLVGCHPFENTEDYAFTDGADAEVSDTGAQGGDTSVSTGDSSGAAPHRGWQGCRPHSGLAAGNTVRLWQVRSPNQPPRVFKAKGLPQLAQRALGGKAEPGAQRRRTARGPAGRQDAGTYF